MVFPVLPRKLRNVKPPTQSQAARRRVRTGTQVCFLWTQLPFSSPHQCAFCKSLTLALLCSNLPTQGKGKDNLCRFTTATDIANLKDQLKENTWCFMIVSLCHMIPSHLYVILSFPSPFPQSGTIEVAKRLSLTRSQRLSIKWNLLPFSVPF